MAPGPPKPAPSPGPRPSPAVFELARALARLAAAEDSRVTQLPAQERP